MRNNFDGLRLIGALLVLWSHMFALSGRPEPLLIGRASYGHLGVLIFFSISGYLVSQSWRRDPRPTRFAAKRILRIVPGVAVALAIAYTTVAALGLRNFPSNPLHHLNGSLWTIPMEVGCYAILAALAWKMPRVGLPMAILMLAGWLAVHETARHSTIVHFGLFFAFGVLLDEYRNLQRLWPTLVFLAAGTWYATEGVNLLALLMIVPPLTIHVGKRSWPVLRKAGHFGDLSYGAYIYAWPVQQLTVAALPRAPYLVLLAIALPITISLAWLSWHFIERPCLQFKPSPGARERLPDLAEVDFTSAGGGPHSVVDLD